MKYATLLLAAAILVASIITARAGDIACSDGGPNFKGYYLVSMPGQIDNNPSVVTFRADSKAPRKVRINFVWDIKTGRGSLNGRPCYETGGM